ncbi:MAG: dethiobiotin synthase [Zetaproteobacteria bacterium CG1_02_53_45]|nr:MAG: dethiobiotin synthase [Zetaproteobacteria bacterium CG1_02_53_45]
MLIFVTATDTDAGKTWVTASAIRTLLKDGKNAKALKPVACGFDAGGRNDDIDALLAAQNRHNPDDICLYQFAKPSAPSQAAAEEGKQVDPQRLVAWCEEKSLGVDTTLIEGVGGLMVPITDNWLVSDWIQATPDAEIWLVVACRLGAINQALLSLNQLKAMERSPGRIIFNATDKTGDAWVKPVIDAVTPFLPKTCTVHQIYYGQQLTD